MTPALDTRPRGVQTLFINGFPPFEVERWRSWKPDPDEDGWNYAHSYTLICPRCQQQWAILAFAGDEDLHIQGAYCDRHGGGTLFWDWHFDRELLRVLPEPLLRREFTLTMRQMGVEI